MDSSCDRNPSPPPELLQQLKEFLPDCVGDSVFSKHWLIQVLISIVESLNKESEAKSDDTASKVEFQDIKEIDQKLEDDICAVWDMSVDRDVAHFLHELKITDILLEAIEKTKCPRLVEIAVGILGNLSSFNDICQDISNNEVFLKTIIPLSGSSDIPTVIQVLRLLRTCIVNETASSIWLNALRNDSCFMDCLKFIFENSLNGEVLKSSFQLLYYILDDDINSSVLWANEDYMKSVCSAVTQLASNKDILALDEVWLLLNLLCQNEENTLAIGNHLDVLSNVFIMFINFIGDFDHNILPPPERSAAFAAGYTTFATLAKQNVETCNKLKDDLFLKTVEKMYKTAMKTLENCKIIEDSSPENNHLRNRETSNNEHSSEDGMLKEDEFCHAKIVSREEYNSLFILKETIFEFCNLIVPSLVQNEFQNGEDE